MLDVSRIHWRRINLLNKITAVTTCIYNYLQNMWFILGGKELDATPMHPHFKTCSLSCFWRVSDSVDSGFIYGEEILSMWALSVLMLWAYFCFAFMWEWQSRKKPLSVKKHNCHNNHFQNLLNWSSYVYPDGEVVKWNRGHPKAVAVANLWRISMWNPTWSKSVSALKFKKIFSLLPTKKYQ